MELQLNAWNQKTMSWRYEYHCTWLVYVYGICLTFCFVCEAEGAVIRGVYLYHVPLCKPCLLTGCRYTHTQIQSWPHLWHYSGLFVRRISHHSYHWWTETYSISIIIMFVLCHPSLQPWLQFASSLFSFNLLHFLKLHIETVLILKLQVDVQYSIVLNTVSDLQHPFLAMHYRVSGYVQLTCISW